jgi:uncharacterized membrane protein YjfL (UPF0719 family)
MSEAFWTKLVEGIISTIVFTCVGLMFFMLSDWIVERVMPRSIRKAIEEDKNVALAIVIGAVFLGIAIIVSSAVHS